MTTDTSTTSELKMAIIDLFAGLLDDLEMNDGTDSGYSDQAITEMHDRNVDLAGFLVGSLGLSDATKDADGYLVRAKLAEPLKYVDEYMNQAS
jgi:hypothetical protein